MVENMKVYIRFKTRSAWFSMPLNEKEVMERLEMEEACNYLIAGITECPVSIKKDMRIEEINSIWKMLSDFPFWLQTSTACLMRTYPLEVIWKGYMNGDIVLHEGKDNLHEIERVRERKSLYYQSGYGLIEVKEGVL